MQGGLFLLSTWLVGCAWAGVGPQKDRVLQARPLSEKDRSEEELEYDHEAFLGDEEAEEFDSLDPLESQRRLAVIVDRVDKEGDGDGKVSLQELQRWIRFVQEREVTEDTARQWEERNPALYQGDPPDRMSWSSYREDVYGHLEEVEGGYSFQPMVDRDRRRWTAADGDGDGLLTKREFQTFLHPEESEHMRDIIVEETLEDMDKDGNDLISLEEFLADLLSREEADNQVPDWLPTERDYFMVSRDKNGDGKLNAQELKEWIFPTDHDPAEAETHHLVFEADANKDGRLTKEEIVASHDLFAGSQATEFGREIKDHDEF